MNLSHKKHNFFHPHYVHQQAIRDLNRAIALDPKLLKSPLDYSASGLVYEGLGDHHQAVRDFDRTIELDPKFAKAYDNRGAAYGNLGDYQQAIKDYKIAARLGLKEAQDNLRSKGISW